MTIPPALHAPAHPRRVEEVVTGRPTSDGAGVKLTRVLSHTLHQRMDPFLLLDAFGSDAAADYIGGFPDHPHRGFETVTYMIDGRMRHRDSAGHEGLLDNGGVQWMTAGRGVIHSEMPEQTEGRMEGFQLWVNLPARDKMCPPTYRDFNAGELPRLTTADGVSVTVIAGECLGITGAVTRPTTQVQYWDVHLPAGTSFSHPLPPGHHAMLYVYRGQIEVAQHPLAAGQLAVLDNAPTSDGVAWHAPQAARVLLISGQPLHEPIVQYGPFVMNSEDEIRQAIADFRAGRLA